MIKNQNISCVEYSGTVPFIKSLQNLINQKYQNLFISILVHGSCATNEVINYSDFDGLLIIKDEFAESKQLKTFIRQSLRIIYKFDPLQHHGWFIIKESDLKNYPQTYFPVEIFEYTRTLFPIKGTELEITMPSGIDYSKPFYTFIASFSKKLDNKWQPANMYQLKSFLSEIMLLPAIYYQAKYKKGISKKDSFNAVKTDFNENEWFAIEAASEIRLKWHYKINGIQRFWSLQSNKWIRKIYKLKFGPKIPNEIKEFLQTDFYESLDSLLIKMNKNINEIYTN